MAPWPSISQADDLANEVRKDIEANYSHEIEQSSKKRKNSQGAGYSRDDAAA